MIAITAAGLWLLLTAALFVEIGGRRATSSSMDLGERWSEASRRSVEVFDAPLDALASMWRGEAASPHAERAAELGVPSLRISIAPQHETRLRDKRDDALVRGVLLTSGADFVPAWVESGDDLVRAKVRLKGDWVDHLQSDQWSLRVRVRGGQLFGMRSFSLHAARTRGGHGELLLLDEMRRAGVLAPRSFPVSVRLNDRELGVMLAEEHFDTHVIEGNARRPGLVLGFDEGPMWEQILRDRELAAVGNPVPNIDPDPLGSPGTMPVRSFRTERLRDDPALRGQFDLAVGLLRGYLLGDLDADDVFDMRLWARHACITSVWGTWHGQTSHNARLYFNPITRLFEPLAYDNGATAKELDVPLEWQLSELVHGPSSARFRAECRRFLPTLYDGAAVARLTAEESRVRSILAQLGDPHPTYPIERLRTRREALESMPMPPQESASFDTPEPIEFTAQAAPVQLLFAYWYPDADGERLELVNCTRSDLVVEHVTRATGRHTEDVPALRGLSIPAGRSTRTRVTRTVPWALDDGGSLTVIARRADHADERIRHVALPGAAPRTTAPLPHLEVEAFAKHEFVDPTGPGSFVIRAGSWDVTSDLVAPRGATLRIEAGATLRFAEGTRCIVRGPLHAAGTDAAPVTFEPIDAAWGGLVVLGEDDPVTLEHTTIRATAGVDDPDWTLTGGVTIHRCDVTIHACHFAGTTCEDALNLVECSFVMRDSTFDTTRSDAFDGDVTRGVVRGCTFTGIGGDAVDVSWSTIEVHALHVARVTDKAVSIGERSTCTGADLTIEDVGTAVVAKDGSSVEVTGVTVRRAAVAGFMAYVKKPEFGPASLSVTDAECFDVEERALVQHESTLIWNHEALPTTRLDVDHLYRTSMRKNR